MLCYIGPELFPNASSLNATEKSIYMLDVASWLKKKKTRQRHQSSYLKAYFSKCQILFTMYDFLLLDTALVFKSDELCNPYSKHSCYWQVNDA